jgi:hypothetical protein
MIIYTYIYIFIHIYVGILTMRDFSLDKCFHFLYSSLMPYWTSLCVLRRTCRQSSLYETLSHCNTLSKHHHHHHVGILSMSNFLLDKLRNVYVYLSI